MLRHGAEPSAEKGPDLRIHPAFADPVEYLGLPPREFGPRLSTPHAHRLLISRRRASGTLTTAGAVVQHGEHLAVDDDGQTICMSCWDVPLEPARGGE
jgi:hypothetical protein